VTGQEASTPARSARLHGSQRDAFGIAECIAVRFALADRVLISTPMSNFGIPYRLKQWIE
jgi:FMN-dependent NADH-azoreductase